MKSISRSPTEQTDALPYLNVSSLNTMFSNMSSKSVSEYGTMMFLRPKSAA